MESMDFTYCKICQVPLTGEAPALQHYAGEKHKKRQSQLETGMLAEMQTRSKDCFPEDGAEFFGDRGFCYVCNKELTSRVVYEQHLAGKNHNKAYETWKKRTSQEIVQKPTLVGMMCSGGLSEAVSPRETDMKPNPAAVSSDSQWSRKCYSFDLDTKEGFCQACDEKFTEFPDLQSHLKTDDHKKMEEIFETTRNKPVKIATPSLSEAIDVNFQSLHERLARTKLAEGINPADNTNWLCCDICNKKVNTREQLRMHMQSPSHKKQLERQKAGVNRNMADQTIWLLCPECNKRVNSTEQLKIHMKCHSSKPWSAVPDSAGSARPMRDCFTECFSSSDSDDANTCDSNVTKDVPTNKQAENELDDRSKRNLPDKSMCEKQELMSYWFPFKCDICDIKFTGEKPYLQHLEGKTHAKNIQQQNIGEGNGTSTRSPYKFHCNICDAYFCTERDRQAHNEGKKHLERAVKANRVPERPHPCIKKNECCDGFNLVEYSPRGYQVELYKQAMLNDTVCFLPTGTGKTLVAVMVLSQMLKLNPYHSAVFLVDKILLGFQQYEVIMKQIGKRLFDRYDADKSQIVERTLNIALVCSGRQNTVNNMPLWRHDVIVATAAYYENLLDNKVLLWEHNCLVVFDESHHCTKEHPYCRLMVNYHHPLNKMLQPKILGLTASPAGKRTFEKTKHMMKELLRKLGNVRLITSESDELQSYCSTTQLIIKKVDLTEGENTLRAALWNHLLKCYQKLQENTDIDKYIESKPVNDLDDDDARAIIMGIADDFNDLMPLVSSKSRENDLQVAALKEHTVVIAEAVLAVSEVGLHYACHILKKLADDAFIGNFSCAEMLHLDCARIKELVAHYDKLKPVGGLEEQDEFPVVKQLILDIVSEVDWDADTEPRPLVLVMVRQRKDAKIFRRILENSNEMRVKNISTVCVVGHGTSNSRGMTVKKQDITFHEILEHKYQVIVATSIAEEGIDIPECELLVQMDPPTNVKSLVQIRGRARKRNSKFIALCRDQNQVDALEALKTQEVYMIKAAKDIVAEQSR